MCLVSAYCTEHVTAKLVYLRLLQWMHPTTNTPSTLSNDSITGPYAHGLLCMFVTSFQEASHFAKESFRKRFCGKWFVHKTMLLLCNLFLHEGDQSASYVFRNSSLHIRGG